MAVAVGILKNLKNQRSLFLHNVKIANSIQSEKRQSRHYSPPSKKKTRKISMLSLKDFSVGWSNIQNIRNKKIFLFNDYDYDKQFEL